MYRDKSGNINQYGRVNVAFSAFLHGFANMSSSVIIMMSKTNDITDFQREANK